MMVILLSFGRLLLHSQVLFGCGCLVAVVRSVSVAAALRVALEVGEELTEVSAVAVEDGQTRRAHAHIAPLALEAVLGVGLAAGLAAEGVVAVAGAVDSAVAGVAVEHALLDGAGAVHDGRAGRLRGGDGEEGRARVGGHVLLLLHLAVLDGFLARSLVPAHVATLRSMLPSCRKPLTPLLLLGWLLLLLIGRVASRELALLRLRTDGTDGEVSGDGRGSLAAGRGRVDAHLREAFCIVDVVAVRCDCLARDGLLRLLILLGSGGLRGRGRGDGRDDGVDDGRLDVFLLVVGRRQALGGRERGIAV